MMFLKKQSNDSWKEKAKERRKENVKLQKRNEEIIKSRDKWKNKAIKLEERNKKINEMLKKNN